MAIISVKSLLDAGVHFGHRVSRWNPKMAPYIFGRRNLIHIINLRETVKGLIRAYYFVKKLTAEGGEVLFVGTKRQAKAVIRRESDRCKMHYVAERWLGGTLTNYTTIRKRLARLEDLEKMEVEGTMASLGKKWAATLGREKRKIDRNLEGIRKMDKLPSAIIVVDPQKEHIAVKEAAKVNIPTICLMDTDSDPDLVDIPIPGNDDAMRSIEVICSKLCDAVVEGRAAWNERQRVEEKKRDEALAVKHVAEIPDGQRFFTNIGATAGKDEKKEGFKPGGDGGFKKKRNKPRRGGTGRNFNGPQGSAPETGAPQTGAPQTGAPQAPQTGAPQEGVNSDQKGHRPYSGPRRPYRPQHDRRDDRRSHPGSGAPQNTNAPKTEVKDATPNTEPKASVPAPAPVNVEKVQAEKENKS